MSTRIEDVVADLLRSRGAALRFATVVDAATVRLAGADLTSFILIGELPEAGTRVPAFVDGRNILVFGNATLTAAATTPSEPGTSSSTGTPLWESELAVVDIGSARSTWSLLHVPLPQSVVLSLNGVTLQLDRDYSVADSIVSLLDPEDVWLGQDDAWSLHATYPYFDDAPTVTPPSEVPPGVFDPPVIDEWSYNGSAVLDAGVPILNQGGVAGSEAGSMVSVAALPSGWSTITLTFTVDIDGTSGSAGNGIAFGLLDDSEAETYVGGFGSGLGVGSAGDAGPTPIDTVACALAWIDTESYYSGDGTGTYLGSRSLGGLTTLESDAGPDIADGSNDYELTFTATGGDRASAVLKWNGSTVLSSTTDLYVPATPRIIIAAGSGSNHQHVEITAVDVASDVTGDPVTPPTPYDPPPTPPLPITDLLTWAPPSTGGYEPYEIPASGGTINLDHRADWELTAPDVVTSNYVRLVGGRNVVLQTGIIMDFPGVPTGSYDSARRGFHIKDGPDPNLRRVIHLQGVWLRDGYWSDGIQIALRSENDTTVVLEDIRIDGYLWGKESGVHSDALQCYGGPRTLLVDGFTAKLCTYQGFFLNPGDDRSLPSGLGQSWKLRRVNLEGATGPDGPAHYLLADMKPGFTKLICEDVYTTGQMYSATDSFGRFPSSGLYESATPPGGDFVPASRWDGGSYTSPGYA